MTGATEDSIRALLEPDREPLDLDDVDRRILHRLHEDARASLRSIAADVEMSAPAVAERISRLERGHVIRRHTVELDWAALGYPMLVVVPIRLATTTDAGAVLSRLREIPALTEVLVLAAGYDLMARFRVRDHADLQRLLIERIWPIPGIEHTETMLSIGRLADPAPLRHVLPTETPLKRRRG
ncbi:Lrp/AsnC family transcriptional regulator [Microbacterium sp. 179-B 1A2 NHS]|uniref:Lrp/AsnC family transcriptional regulator n=1 Tax=Microbacterium sp. 179-B 1A2 NHS TaxID=3142383 RepID=UPI0039A25278